MLINMENPRHDTVFMKHILSETSKAQSLKDCAKFLL